MYWDVLLLSETWREEREEHFRTELGHHFVASGGTRGEKGVAILIIKRWSSKIGKIQSISERLIAVDIETIYAAWKLPNRDGGTDVF